MEKRTVGKELLADEIAQKIKNKIQNLVYKPGARLTVRKLCEEYGTSETPVKQALNQLVTTGLVISIPKCGMRVRTFEFEDLKASWEARLMVEEYCAAFAVEEVRRNEAYVKKMQKCLEISNTEYEKCIRDYTHENFNLLQEYDRPIHMEIVNCCKNKPIIDFYDGLNAHAGMYVGYRAHSPETLETVVQQHTKIVDSLLLCDLDGLKSALRQHIYSTIQIYRKASSKE